MACTFRTALMLSLIATICGANAAAAPSIEWQGRTFNLSNVTAAVVELDGERVLKVERDLNALPFDPNNLAATVDEPTFATIEGLDLADGVIEVKILSRLQTPSPFPQAQGFIGLCYRVQGTKAFESIYLRPNVGRSEDQFARNHTVQYFAYPDWKFDRLRKESRGEYETYADIGLDEWIAMRIEFKGKRAALYLNGQRAPSFLVNDMKGDGKSGTIGLWVDIGTVGYFKDLHIRRTN